jgi:para-aminobenzoate synthetase / 4-amino-4-deoxychorismate lyase
MTALPPEVPEGRYPLLLAPTGQRGWFGGVGLRAADPVQVVGGATLAEAGAALQAAFESEEPVLVAAVVPYEGPATLLTYHGWSEVETGLRAPAVAGIGPATPLVRDPDTSMTGRDYRAAVREVRARIAAGDVYVLNLTRTLSGTAAGSARELFRALHARAGAEMSAFLGIPGNEIASVSPERFVSVKREGSTRVAEIWPIKGTGPRGADVAADAAIAVALAADEKERAEHVMVVDMERNDLGRVCEPGSVEVAPLMEVVAAPYCHQMVSRVRGTLRADATFADLLAATFPCGSVTGAPKIAAVRIAAELEGGPRGVYTGSLLVARPGELDSSVLIRTAVLEGDLVSWGTGCGITCESDAAAEWLETLLKASPILGDGVPPVALRETCRVTAGRVPLLAYHLSRLVSGGCGPSVLARVRAAVGRALEGADPAAAYGRLAVTVMREGEVTAKLSSEPSSLHVEDGPEVVPVVVAAPPRLPPGAAKPAERAPWDEAQRQAGPGSQAILTLADGRLVDGATASIWVRRGEALLTPPAPPAVAGVAREAVFDLAGECGFRAAEAELTTADLAEADEVFFSNAVAGVVAARGRGGRAAAALAAAFECELGFPQSRR